MVCSLKEGYETRCVLSADGVDEMIAWLGEKMRKDGEVYVLRGFLQDVDWVIDILCRNVSRMSEEQLRAFNEAIW